MDLTAYRLLHQRIVNVTVCLEVRPHASVTMTVAVLFPADKGVPDRIPVDAFNARPAGRVPVFEYAYGGLPVPLGETGVTAQAMPTTTDFFCS